MAVFSNEKFKKKIVLFGRAGFYDSKSVIIKMAVLVNHLKNVLFERAVFYYSKSSLISFLWLLEQALCLF